MLVVGQSVDGPPINSRVYTVTLPDLVRDVLSVGVRRFGFGSYYWISKPEKLTSEYYPASTHVNLLGNAQAPTNSGIWSRTTNPLD